MQNVLLIGTGQMAKAHAVVLKALGARAVAVGRSDEHAKTFQEETGVPTVGGGLESYLANAKEMPSHAIVVIDVANIPEVTVRLLDVGIKNILVEKPASFDQRALLPLAKKAFEQRATIVVGYNRRCLASVQRARELIVEDGGAISVHFEFNERTTQPERIARMNTPKATVEHWFYANSTHVIDLAMYLAGEIERVEGFSAAGPLWAPHPTLFSGAGVTGSGAPLTYYANWEVDGPWRVEVQTKARKLILDPLEKLFVEKNGVQENVAFEDTLDTTYRPGLYAELRDFLAGESTLPILEEQLRHFKAYDAIFAKRT